MVKCAWLLLLTLPLGCGSDNPGQPNPGPTPIDAGGSGGGPDAPPANPPPGPVTGTQITLCRLGADTVGQPTDLTKVIVRAWIPEATDPTGFRIQPGAGHADGTFEIQGIPTGTRYLLQLEDEFFATDQRVINANFVANVRCNPQFARAPAPVTLDLTNMSPFAAGDAIAPVSYSTNNGEFDATSAQPGDTSIADTFDWFATLPVASLGDDFTVLHTHTDSQLAANGQIRQVDHIVDAFMSHDVTLREGTPTTVTGQFTPASPATMPIDLDAGPYLAPYQATAELDGFSIGISAGPFAATSLFGANLGDLSIFGPGLASLALHDEVPFADPFPATWARAVQASASMVRFYASTSPQFLFGLGVGGTQQVAFTGTPAPTFAPALPPASNFQINGADVSQGRTIAFDGKAPITLSWQAAAGATLYLVDVWRIDVGSPTGGGTFIGFLTTPDTSIVVPASLLANNRFYAFSLSAIDHTPGYATGRLFEDFTSFRQSTLASARLRFSSTCGDGKIDLGEECDDKGESATCNADCTLAACGDGILNTTAGEACDTITDTATCAAQSCSLVSAPTRPRRAAMAALTRQPVATPAHLPARTQAWRITRTPAKPRSAH